MYNNFVLFGYVFSKLTMKIKKYEKSNFFYYFIVYIFYYLSRLYMLVAFIDIINSMIRLVIIYTLQSYIRNSLGKLKLYMYDIKVLNHSCMIFKTKSRTWCNTFGESQWRHLKRSRFNQSETALRVSLKVKNFIEKNI